MQFDMDRKHTKGDGLNSNVYCLPHGRLGEAELLSILCLELLEQRHHVLIALKSILKRIRSQGSSEECDEDKRDHCVRRLTI